MSYITAIGTANPPHRFKQTVIAEFMIRAMALEDEDARKLKNLYRATGIETRYSVLADYGKNDRFDFYSNTANGKPAPSTEKRMDLFKRESLLLSLAAVRDCLKENHSPMSEITHLIVVSCTGMYAPGLDIDLVNSLGLRTSIQRMCINFMGCYAAFNALKLADVFCKGDPHAKVLVVCTELCSIHFQQQNTEDNMLANALFADGSAALLVEAQPRKGWNLKALSFHCDLAPQGEKEMSWQVGDLGFEMRLSAYVPALIKDGIKKLTNELLKNSSESFGSINYFAIHPGGKRILEVVEEELGISKDRNHFSREVLKKFGNMSSPTVLFVLREIMMNLKPEDVSKKILSFAFGPGLTLESMLLSIEKHSE